MTSKFSLWYFFHSELLLRTQALILLDILFHIYNCLLRNPVTFHFFVLKLNICYVKNTVGNPNRNQMWTLTLKGEEGYLNKYTTK